jgi:Tol biopolymer transport system component
MAGLGVVLVYGVFLGVWADSHGEYQGNLVSTWYLPAFLGYFASVIALLAVGSRHAARRAARGDRTRHLAPPGYEPALAGAALIVVMLLVDLVWQAIFGAEVDVERNLSPPRVLLALGVMLLAAGPLVASWRRVEVAGEVALATHDRDTAADATRRPSLGHRLPQVISLGLTLAALTFLAFFATPATQHWAERFPGDTPLARPGDIWVMAADGSAQTRLTYAEPDVATYQEPVWLPDGSGLGVIIGRAVGGGDAQGVAYDLGRMRADGSEIRRLVETPDFDGQAYLSPDASQLAFSSERVTSATMPTAAPAGATTTSGSPAPVTAGGAPLPGRDPGLGVQGGGGTQQLASGSRWDIYVMGADGTHERRLTEGGTINIVTGWAADGRLLFHSDRDGDFEIYSMRADGSDVRQLTDDPGVDIWPAWGPEGRLAFSSDRSGDFDIWLAQRDGSDPRAITGEEGDDWQPAWSPDGATIAFLTGRERNVEVYAVPASGGAARDLSRSPATDEQLTAGAWSPDGTRITYSTRPLAPGAADPEMRTLLAVAALVVWAATLAGLVLAAVRLGTLPRGAITVAMLIAAIPAGLASDEPRIIAAALVAGIVGDLVLVLGHPGPSRPRLAWLLGALLPATWAAAYLAAVAVTTGTGLSAHVLGGAVVLSGIVGLLMAVVIMRDRPVLEHPAA